MIHRRPSRHISKCSLFASLRAIPRVGPTRIPIDLEDESLEFADPVSDALGLRHQNRVSGPGSSISVEANAHLGYAHHDARIHFIEHDSDRLHVTFNHYDVERLAACILDYPPRWRKLERAFPITLVIDGITEFHWVETVENGVLQKVRHSFSTLATAFASLDALFAWEVEPEQVGVVVRGFRHRQFRRRRRRFHDADAQLVSSDLCVCASAIEVEADVHPNWVRVFGPDSGFILDRFLGYWPENTSQWGVVAIQNWLTSNFSGEEAKILDRAREHALKWLESHPRFSRSTR